MNPKQVLRRTAELGIGLTAIVTLILAGCGGSSKTTSTSSAAMTTLTISPALGMFREGARIRIKDRNGNQVGTATTNVSGVASVAVPTAAATPLVVEAGLDGDKYYDEAKASDVVISGAIGAAVRAIVPDHTAASQVAVTALTEIAVGALLDASGVLPATVTAASAVGANATVATAFGLSDVLTPPKLVASSNEIAALGTTESDKYAIKLAALAHMAATNEDALKVAHRLRDNLRSATPASSVRDAVVAMNTKVALTGAPANAQTAATVTTLPRADIKLLDLAKANMDAAKAQLDRLSTQLTKAQQINEMLNASLSNASAVIASLNQNVNTSIQSAVQAALSLAQSSAAATQPVIASFTPASGVVGATVTITGTGFNATLSKNEVRFNNGSPATITNASTTALTVTVPSGATTGLISVTNLDVPYLNYSKGTSVTSFTVTTATSGTNTGGTGGGTTYALADLAGNWMRHRLQAGVTTWDPATSAVIGLNAKWSYGQETYTAAGSATPVTDVISDGSPANTTPFSITLTSDGTFGNSDLPSMHGTVSKDKQLIVATATAGNGNPRLVFFQKQGGTFTSADFVGTWDRHVIRAGRSDSLGGNISNRWEHGVEVWDANGNATEVGNEVWSIGTPIATNGYQYSPFSIAPDGTITVSASPTVHGTMSLSKDLVILTKTAGNNLDQMMVIFQKRVSGVTYSTADLEGTWARYLFRPGRTLSNGTTRNNWEYGLETWNANGYAFEVGVPVNMMGTGSSLLQGYDPNVGWGNFTIDANGIINSPIDANLGLQPHGRMSADKNLVVLTRFSGNGIDPVIVIFVRR